jgi:hypothetical protein
MQSETRLKNLAELARLGLVDTDYWPRPLLDYLGGPMTGDLHLRGLHFWELPNGLKVGGSLDLSWSTIQSLPSGLEVGGSLYLTGSLVRALPADLEVSGEIIGFCSIC